MDNHATVFTVANVLLAVFHVFYASVFFYGMLGRSLVTSKTARLSLPLFCFFVTGIVTHLCNAIAGDDVVYTGWIFAFRCVVVVVCLPMTKLALEAIKYLPTKEQYEASLQQLQEHERLSQARVLAEINRLDSMVDDLNSLRLDVNDSRERQLFRSRVDALVSKFQDVRIELEQERSTPYAGGNGPFVR